MFNQHNWIFALIVAVAVSGCASSGPPVSEVVVPLVAMNDFHGALYEQPLRGRSDVVHGGLPWLVSAVAYLRERDPDLVTLDAGDLFQGSLPVNASQGMGAIQAMELVGIDAAAVGNHEFDYGPVSAEEGQGGHALRGAVERAIAASSFQWLAANIYRGETGQRWDPPGLAPWALMERGGATLGLIGLATGETPQTTRAQYVDGLTFVDVVEELQRTIPVVREAGADAIIVLGHLSGGCPVDVPHTPTAPCTPNGEVGRLLEELPRGSIDVLVAGHRHIMMAFRFEDTFVLEAGSHGRALNRLDLVVGPGGVDVEKSILHPPWILAHEPRDPGCSGEPFPMEATEVGGVSMRPDGRALALVEALESRAENRCTRVGCAERELTRDFDTESEVGNLVADACLAVFDDADFAIQNSGGLRADLRAGDITLGDIYSVMPFDNQLMLVELTGEQVQLLMRIGTSGGHGILQVAGLRADYDPTVESGTDLDGDSEVSEWERNRLCSVSVGGAALRPEQTYRVAISDFLLGGGDHLGPALEGAKVIREGPPIRDALRSYLGGFGGCVDASREIVDPNRPRLAITACGSN